MKHLILPMLIGTSLLAATAHAAEYTMLESDKSKLTFVYTQMGVPVDGLFKRFNTQLNFDPAKLANAKAVFDLDLASIDAGSDEANDEVAGKAWFNTKVFPRAKFESTGFKSLGANRYEVSGKMTIKGRSQSVSAPFTLTAQGNTATVDGAFTLKRNDFGIGDGSWSDVSIVANEIQIKFHFLAKSGK